MFGRWFKRGNRLEHPHSEIRLQAVQGLTAEQAEQEQTLLERIAEHDPNAEVRRAALEHVLNPDALVKLLDEDDFADDVAKQIAQRIKSGRPAACHKDERVLAARIALADADDLDGLWPLISKPEHCVALVLRLRDEARDRVLTHPQLNTEHGLSVLQRAVRGRDKSLHRYARQRLDAIKAAHAQCGDAMTRLAELDAAIDKSLKSHPADASAVISHRQKLKKLGDMRTAVVEEFGVALTTLASSGGDVDEFTIPPDPLTHVDLSLPDPDNNPFTRLVAEFESLQTAMHEGAPLEEVSQQRDVLTKQWLAEADKFPPSSEQHHIFERVAQQFHAYHRAWQNLANIEDWQFQLPDALPSEIVVEAATNSALEQLRRWRKRWQKKISSADWPRGHTPPPLLTTARNALARVSDDVARLEAAISAAGEELDDTLKQASQAIDAGKLEPAKRYLRRARALQKAGLKARDREIGVLSAQVAEYDDWQHFATDPKRHGLLSTLQSLADQPEDPPQQAAKLKALRQEWQQLGHPSSREEAELQQEFDRLADLAFAPCRTYYDEQARLRADNLAQRESLCDQLQTYIAGTDWADADMQAAETILRSAREEWHRYHPCERKALRPVQRRFEALQDELHAKVKARWNENLALKQAVVDQAKALLDEDLDAQIDGAKRLQQAWRNVGKTPRGPDQKLWREFRQICDQIFAQREASHQAYKREQEQAYTQLDQAIEALAKGASGSAVSRKTFNELCADIDHATANLTISGHHTKRIRHAQEAYQAALRMAQQAQAADDLVTWRTWDEAVSRAEAEQENMAAPHPVFAHRLAGDAKPAEWLQLVLEAEIAADLPSPAHDQTARMALQIELMNAGRRDLGAEDYRALLKRWCEAGPKIGMDDELRERFFQALAKRI